MSPGLVVVPDDRALARRAAEWLLERTRAAVAAQTALLTDLQARTLSAYTLIIGAGPALGTYSFNAYVVAFETALKHTDKCVFSGTLKIVGKPTWA